MADGGDAGDEGAATQSGQGDAEADRTWVAPQRAADYVDQTERGRPGERQTQEGEGRTRRHVPAGARRGERLGGDSVERAAGQGHGGVLAESDGEMLRPNARSVGRRQSNGSTRDVD